MKETTIKVLKVAPGEHPEIVTLKNTLDALQQAVSIGAEYQGLIELVPIDDGVLLLCNEEGKLIGLEPNRRVGADVIAGVFYIVGENDEGDLASLPDAVLEDCKARFWEPELLTQEDLDLSLFLRFFPL